LVGNIGTASGDLTQIVLSETFVVIAIGEARIFILYKITEPQSLQPIKRLPG
jgi:hypothetical protein